EPVEVVVYEDVLGSHERSELGLDAAHVRLLDRTRLAGALCVDGDVVLAIAQLRWQIRQRWPPALRDVLTHDIGSCPQDLVIEFLGADLLARIEDPLQHRIGRVGGQGHKKRSASVLYNRGARGSIPIRADPRNAAEV